jgi:hypothetical protein
MKLENLCKAGFMLVEATVGVAVFFVVLTLALQAIGFMVQQTVMLQRHHYALCAATYYAQPSIAHAVETDAYKQVTVIEHASAATPAYAHHSVPWYEITVKNGDQCITLYSARCAA